MRYEVTHTWGELSAFWVVKSQAAAQRLLTSLKRDSRFKGSTFTVRPLPPKVRKTK